MTVINEIRINGRKVALESLPEKERAKIVRDMNVRAVWPLNYVLREKAAD